MTCIVNLKDSHHLSLHIIQTPFNTEGTRISVDCEGPDNALFKVKLLWDYEYIKKKKKDILPSFPKFLDFWHVASLNCCTLSSPVGGSKAECLFVACCYSTAT